MYTEGCLATFNLHFRQHGSEILHYGIMLTLVDRKVDVGFQTNDN